MRTLFFTLSLGLVTACTSTQDSGSLSDYSISDSAYERAYDSKFASENDRLGWSQDQQMAWSRGGAAAACGLAFDKDIYLTKLDQKFPNIGKTLHDLNGVTFHELQIVKNEGFCTDARKSDAQAFISNF